VLDDFGAGYTSLRHIQSFPFNKIKIDRSFIEGLEDDPASAAIVKALAGLGEDLGFVTVAEGVETAAQRDLAIQLGCLEAQGYLFDKALPLEQISFRPRRV
jgi:EAL domain-containing protein (putative c-di-GMP-specific phosphodiesterase class I)